MDPDPIVQEYSKDAIQTISRQYYILLDVGYFEFLKENLHTKPLEKTRRILVKSTNNIVQEMIVEEKKKVLEILEPGLQHLLGEDIPSGLEKEILELLKMLGVYDLPFRELFEHYLSRIKNHRDPGIFRSLILRDHHQEAPIVMTSLINLHKASDEKVRSIIKNEFPLWL